MQLTMSSIFIMLLTVSAASLMAEVDTNRGCTTFSSKMLVIVPYGKGGVQTVHKCRYIQYIHCIAQTSPEVQKYVL